MEKKDKLTLRERRSEMGCLHRADGSCAYAQGKTSVWCSVFGPGDLKVSRQVVDRAVVDVFFKPKVTTTPVSGQFGNIEAHLRDICSTCLLLKQFPRHLISVTIQEMQNDGSLISAAVNSCCLAFMDAGLPMKSLFCAVTIAVTKDKDLVLDPEWKVESQAEALLNFALQNRPESEKEEICGCWTDGSFSVGHFRKARELALNSAKEIFQFYRNAVEKKYSGDKKDSLENSME